MMKIMESLGVLIRHVKKNLSASLPLIILHNNTFFYLHDLSWYLDTGLC